LKGWRTLLFPLRRADIFDKGKASLDAGIFEFEKFPYLLRRADIIQEGTASPFTAK
jgi:hypothetical protein